MDEERSTETRMSLRSKVSVLFCGLLVVAGCSKGGYSGPTGTVQGKVLLNGEPVPQGCHVSFISDKGYTGTGTVGAGGAYTLTNVDKPEIPVAEYRVCVTPPTQAKMTDAEYEKMMSAGGAAPPAPAPAATR